MAENENPESMSEQGEMIDAPVIHEMEAEAPEQKESYIQSIAEFFSTKEEKPKYHKIKLHNLVRLQKEFEAKFAEFELPTKQLEIARNLVNVVKEFGDSAFEKLADFEEPKEENEEEKAKRLEGFEKYQTAMSAADKRETSAHFHEYFIPKLCDKLKYARSDVQEVSISFLIFIVLSSSESFYCRPYEVLQTLSLHRVRRR